MHLLKCIYIKIYAESRGPDPHSLNTNELLSRQPLFLTGLFSKKMKELVYLSKIPDFTYPELLFGRLAKIRLYASLESWCLIRFELMLQVPQTCVLTTNTINTMSKFVPPGGFEPPT